MLDFLILNVYNTFMERCQVRGVSEKYHDISHTLSQEEIVISAFDPGQGVDALCSLSAYSNL